MITHRLMLGALTLAANIYAGVVLAEKINMNNSVGNRSHTGIGRIRWSSPWHRGRNENGRIPYPAL